MLTIFQQPGLVPLKGTASQGYSKIPVRDSEFGLGGSEGSSAYRTTLLAKTALVQHHSHSPKQVNLDLIQPLCRVETTPEGQHQASSTVSSGIFRVIGVDYTSKNVNIFALLKLEEPHLHFTLAAGFWMLLTGFAESVQVLRAAPSDRTTYEPETLSDVSSCHIKIRTDKSHFNKVTHI